VDSEEAKVARNRPAIGSTKRARRLRNNPTDAERRLWRILRHCFPDARFRRQVPVGSYVVDFCSMAQSSSSRRMVASTVRIETRRERYG
jgi:very-short-patch-repair endonuclease